MAKVMTRKARLRELEARMAAVEAQLNNSAPTVPAAAPVQLAHILAPAAKLQEALNGKQPESLCGEKIGQRPSADTNVCRKCFDLNRIRQEQEALKWMTDKREEGRVAGETQGIRTGTEQAQTAIREAAERRAGELASAGATA